MYIHLPIDKLKTDKRRIARVIDRLEGQLQVQVDPNIDEADPEMTNQTIIIALLNNARQKAEAIDRALNRAQAGRYGLCEDCGQAIDPERLAIFPQATLCVPCKGARETPGRRRGANGF